MDYTVDDDGASSVALAVARALAGSYVLKFMVRSSLINGAFSDGDDDAAAACVHRSCDCVRDELRSGAQLVASMSGAVPTSLGEMVALSCIGDGASPESDSDLVEAMSAAHDNIADAWRHAAEVAMAAGEREVAQFAAERCECHAEAADCLDDLSSGGSGTVADGDVDDSNDDDTSPTGDLDTDVAAGPVTYVDEAARPKREGHRPKPGSRPYGEIHHSKATSAAGERPRHAGGSGERIGTRTAAEISASIAKDRVGKPLRTTHDLHKMAAKVHRMPVDDRRRVRRVGQLTHAEIMKKIAGMKKSG
jgi:hypothetical protein